MVYISYVARYIRDNMNDTLKTMKIFLDTADTQAISDGYETGLIDGITTNPTLIMKSG